jgi:hypothetical protein
MVAILTARQLCEAGVDLEGGDAGQEAEQRPLLPGM